MVKRGLAMVAAMLPAVALAAPAGVTTHRMGAAPMVGQVAAPAARPGWGPGGWNRGGMQQPGRPGGNWGAPGDGYGHWQGGAPGRWQGGWGGYRRPFVGYVLPQTWYSPSWYIPNYAGWGLAAPAAGQGWYRYYDDAVLVDGRGTVRDYRAGLDWDRGGRGDAVERAYDDGYDDGFDDGVDYAEDVVTYRGKPAKRAVREGYGGSFGPTPGRPPAVYSSRAGAPYAPPPPGPDYGVRTYRSNPYVYGAGPGATVYGAPGGATVVVVQSAPSVTTTTTTTTSYETVTPRRTWRAACNCKPTKAAWRPRGKTLRR